MGKGRRPEVGQLGGQTVVEKSLEVWEVRTDMAAVASRAAPASAGGACMGPAP